MRPRSIPPSFVASVCHPSSWAGRRVTRVITRGEALQTLRDSVVTLLLLLVVNACLTTLPRSSSRITSSSQCVFPGATPVGLKACFHLLIGARGGVVSLGGLANTSSSARPAASLPSVDRTGAVWALSQPSLRRAPGLWPVRGSGASAQRLKTHVPETDLRP